MKIEDLSKALDLFYKIGKERKECNALVQCFGIKYANVIEQECINYKEIGEKSSLKGTKYATEIYKGIKLAKYVKLKDEIYCIESDENY